MDKNKTKQSRVRTVDKSTKDRQAHVKQVLSSNTETIVLPPRKGLSRSNGSLNFVAFRSTCLPRFVH